MSPYKSFAVIGAGNIGLKIVQALAAQPGISVVVFRRITSAGTTLDLPPNVKSVGVDYTNSPDVLAALQAHGVEVVVSTISYTAITLQTGLADVAKEAGAKLFVPSEFGLPTELFNEAKVAPKTAFAEHLKSIGLPFTRYYTGQFMEYTPWIVALHETKKFNIVGKGDKPVSMTSMSDIAGFVAYTLTTLPPSKLANATFRIQGACPTLSEVGALYEGKFPIEYVNVIPKDLPMHEIRTFLQTKMEEGVINTAEGGEEGERGDSGNGLWQGHEWQGLKEVLKL